MKFPVEQPVAGRVPDHERECGDVTLERKTTAAASEGDTARWGW